MSCIQFWTAAVISAAGMLIFEQPDPQALLDAWLPVCYAGVLSSGVGYTLQIVGQKDVNPTLASLIMSLESVISVIAGWVLLHQTMGAREIAAVPLCLQRSFWPSCRSAAEMQRRKRRHIENFIPEFRY